MFRCRCGSYANVFALRCIYCPFALESASRCTAAFPSSQSGGGDLGKCGGCSIPDRVTSSQSDPLRNRSVLLLGSRELLLRAEGLVALWTA
jgi:hypothetical protein